MQWNEKMRATQQAKKNGPPFGGPLLALTGAIRSIAAICRCFPGPPSGPGISVSASSGFATWSALGTPVGATEHRPCDRHVPRAWTACAARRRRISPSCLSRRQRLASAPRARPSGPHADRARPTYPDGGDPFPRPVLPMARHSWADRRLEIGALPLRIDAPHRQSRYG